MVCMKTWFDLEPLLDKIETLDKATIEEFSIIQPPPSQNPAFHHKFDHAIQRILHRLQQIKNEEIALQNNSNNDSNDYWYKKPIGIIGIGIITGTLVMFIKWLFGF